MHNKYKKLISNSAWTLVGNAGSKLLGFLLLPLYTRWLGTEGFGESDLITAYASCLFCLVTLCIIEAIFVFSKNTSNENKRMVFSSSLLLVFIFLLIWSGVFFLLEIFFTVNNISNSFSNNLWLIYWMMVSTACQQSTQQFLLSINKIKTYSLIGITLCVLTFVLSFIMIPKMGVRGYVISFISANIVTSLFCVVVSRTYIFFSFTHFSKNTIRGMLRYSIPLIPNSIMWWLVSTLNRPLMEHHLDYSSIGIYAVAAKFPGVIVMLFSVFSVAWNISVFEEYEKPGFSDFYKKTYRMVFFLLNICSGIIILFSKEIIQIVSPPEFHEAWKYMCLLLVGAIFQCMGYFLGSVFSVVKQSKYYFFTSLWGALTAIVINVVFIPIWGVWGAALSVVFSFVAMALSRYIYSLRYVKTSLLPVIAKIIIFLLIYLFIAYCINNMVVKIIAMFCCFLMFAFWERDIVKPSFDLIVNKLLNFRK